jgi:hypothetical protein
MRRKARVALSAAALGTLVLGIASIAGAHGGDKSKIHSCVNKKTRAVRIVAPSAKCKPTERAVDWGVQGPAGPAGPPGPATGPAGGDLTGNYPNPQIASVPWNKVTDVPAGFADGTDDDGSLQRYCALVKAHPRSFPDEPCRVWSELVDGPLAVGKYNSIAIGIDGNPVVSYFDDGDDALKVAHCDDPLCTGDGETVTTVDPGGAPAPVVGLYTSIAIGTDGNPVVSYYDQTNGNLKVAYCNDRACAGGGETISAVDGVAPVANVGEFSSISIGTDGNPVISYYDRTNGNLKFARCNDPACSIVGAGEAITVVDGAGSEDVGRHTSLEIGTDGNPVISYLDFTNFNLKVARCNDITCLGNNETITAVDTTLGVGEYTSIAIGTDGNPVVSYQGTEPANELKVARCNDPACAGGNEAINTVVGTWSNSMSIAIGVEGNPVISYVDGTGSGVKLARCNDPACAGGNEAISVVDPSLTVGDDTSVAIRPDGVPIVSYFEDSTDDLRVARPPVAP